MTLPMDFTGPEADQLKPTSPGQSYGRGAKPQSEQIAAWGGLTSEAETNSSERDVSMPLPRDYDKPGGGPA